MYYFTEMKISLMIIFLFGLAIFLKITRTVRICRSNRTLDGKTVIVTGANTGIGLETARDLAHRGAKVILACRNLDKARKASEDIIRTSGNQNVLIKHLDLSSLSSVRNFAKDIIENEERLDILVNNAGVVPSAGDFTTEDNLELQFATNYFGPFLLTNLLLPLLIKCAPSRIVMVSSVTYIFSNMDLENFSPVKYTRHPYLTYADTKLAIILFTRSLSKRLADNKVTVNALHPGIVSTAIDRNLNWMVKYFIVPFLRMFAENAKNGAQTSIYLAVSEEVENVSGEYFDNCRPRWLLPKARNDNIAEKLWTLSEKITALK